MQYIECINRNQTLIVKTIKIDFIMESLINDYEIKNCEDQWSFIIKYRNILLIITKKIYFLLFYIYFIIYDWINKDYYTKLLICVVICFENNIKFLSL